MNSDNTLIDPVTKALNFTLGKSVNMVDIIWYIFLGAIFVFSIYSLILVYHWIKFGQDSAFIWVGMIVYSIVSFILLSTMYIATINI